MLNITDFLTGGTAPDITGFIVPVLSAILLGLILAAIHMFLERNSSSFILALALLPAIVCTVIMAVNGNIGAGVAVAGAFSLVRFRSAPGTAREIASIFFAMTLGLLCGMGNILYAALFTLIMGLVMLIFKITKFGTAKEDLCHKSLRITIPEDLDYTGVFDDLFDQYLKDHTLVSSKTSGMGSLYKLNYEITLKSEDIEKEFIDKLRCRNGNLEIAVSVIRPREQAEL